ncbi:hypothetical protein CPter291_2410 [Collimonas pratensis]|uniref:Uncharacterized protein n=1 Tax=Collimonas pratensis TaxID=279113 RepID=A0A127QY13_9BURK|nr:hypothetical protein CPter91_2912 [Collimonas pratensis]AMP14667.1 hypothetical protein CPter291_2410 [Collimonas pratensis]
MYRISRRAKAAQFGYCDKGTQIAQIKIHVHNASITKNFAKYR